MDIFSVLVTDDPNCWFAVKLGICILKTHARLHDCTRLQTSDHEDFLLKKTSVCTHSSGTPSHINPTVNSVYLHKNMHHVLPQTSVVIQPTQGCIIWLMPSLVWLRVQVCWELQCEVSERWNAATLWSSVRVFAPTGGSRSGQCFVVSFVMPPCPPSKDWPGKCKDKSLEVWREMNGKSSHVVFKKKKNKPLLSWPHTAIHEWVEGL